MNREKLPFISIIIPAYNEEKYITKVLSSIEEQTYPVERMEVLVVDGGSTDKTKEVVLNYQKRSSLKIRILDNPGKIPPKAMNIGIKNAKGEYIVRLDAHAVYNKDYVKTAILKLMENKNLGNVGGYWIVHPGDKSVKAKAIALAFSNPFGGGSALYRTAKPEKERFVDTVPYGAYPRSIFDEIGYYDESLVRGQDIELNGRILKSGKKILLTPEMRIDYFLKLKNFKDVAKRHFFHGSWLFQRKRGKGVRHFVPLIFLLTIFLLFALSFFNVLFLYLLLFILFVYISAGVFFIYKTEKKFPSLKVVLFALLSFFIMHVAFGVGSIVSLWKKVWKS